MKRALYLAAALLTAISCGKTVPEGKYASRAREAFENAWKCFRIPEYGLFSEYSACKTYIDVFITNLEYAWEHGRMDNGLFYEDWTGKNVNPDRDKSLLMQAAALESLATVALYKGERK